MVSRADLDGTDKGRAKEPDCDCGHRERPMYVYAGRALIGFSRLNSDTQKQSFQCRSKIYLTTWLIVGPYPKAAESLTRGMQMTHEQDPMRNHQLSPYQNDRLNRYDAVS